MRMGLAGLLGVVLVALYIWGESLAGMLSCDYNGWTDAPEDEREELDRYFSDVLSPGLRSPVATAEHAAMPLTSQDASSRPGVALPRRPLAPRGREVVRELTRLNLTGWAPTCLCPDL